MAEIVLKEVSKQYNGVKAVDSLCLDVQDGEFMVVLGPPGAGKSSTAKMIAGVEVVTSGEVLFDGNPMGTTPPNKRNVAMVFESYALYPHLTAFDNIAYPLKSRKGESGISNQEIKERIEKMAEMLQIPQQLYRKPAFLSGGQRQRVALARALVREPSVFLLDEPIAHLDARLRHHLRGELKRLHKERPTTTIWCTPDYLEGIAMGDRVAVLYEGDLKQIGPPSELLRNPASVEVAQFVGDPPMNIVTARVEQDGGTLWLNLDGVRLAASGNQRDILNRHNTPGEVLVGIRPGDVTIHQSAGEPGSLQTTLYATETLHRKTVVSFTFDSGLIKVNASADFRGKVGDPMWISLVVDNLHLFDAQTGLTMME